MPTALRRTVGQAVSGELIAQLGDVWVRVAAVQAIIPVTNRPEKTTLVLCGSMLDIDLPIDKVVRLLASAEDRNVQDHPINNPAPQRAGMRHLRP